MSQPPGVKSSFIPGRDSVIKEVRIQSERYTANQLPTETDPLPFFVVGKKRIKRKASQSSNLYALSLP